MKKILIINKTSITVYTIIMILLSILTFEIGYCNTEWLRNTFADITQTQYNFSLCRIVIYIVFILLYIIFKNVFIKEALEVASKKYKRVLIYITIVLVVCSIAMSFIFCSIDLNLLRAVSIGLITAFLGSLFVIYISNNIIKNVIVISATLGIIFTFTTSYNHAIDEKRHFMSAVNLSFLNFDYENNPITDKNIEKLPQLSKFTTIDNFFGKYEQDVTDKVNLEDAPSLPAPYNFLTYTFPAIGIALARFLDGSIIDMYILGRIMNLILYTLLICIALKIMPYKKNIFFVLAMMPYMLLLAASYSIDGYCIGIIYIFIAYCLKIKKEKDTISFKNLAIIVALFILVLLAKSMAYILVGCIVLMLPLINTIKKNKKYIPLIVICTIVLTIAAIFLVMYVKDTKLVEDSRASGEISSSKQLELLLTNPIHDIKLLIEHTKNSLLNFDWYSMLHYEIFFTKDAKCVMLPLMIFILYVSLTETDYIFKIRDKIFMITVFLMVWAMTSLALYLSFTQVGALSVAGYQTRYIVPILPLVLFGIANNKVLSDKKENRTMNIAIISAIFIGIGIAQLIIV